ncbi:uncharacterized protein LOC103976329 isoform X2 [Musa acuminata AAA Group]|uniref:uncharacterized protein LOC103976329 isoform X2 n=1 Tax=Musa acuminata AAA Group TaxID=214697 RepID=UPI0031D70C92
MGGPLSQLLLLIYVIFSSLLLSSSSESVAGTGGDASSSRSSGARLEWQILTKRNFSSQIRLHPQILLMVTVPWSGESRSLMKEVAHLVANNQDKLDFLKLMVIYRSSEKMLADILGATEEITLFYYHNSMSYKYHGRLRAENILSSVNRFQSLEPEELPLKLLQTPEDVENFFLSTDKAVLLLEFCGWSAKLLRRKNNGNYETPMSAFNHSENVGIIGQSINREMVDDFHVEHHKGMENRLTCAVEDGLGRSVWLKEYTLANQSTLEQLDDGGAGTRMLCTDEEFKQFETFFMKFTAIAREFFLPPERQRFGLISDGALLSFLGISSPDKWLVMLHFSGCSNCTMIVQQGDDLRNILQTHHSLIMEFDVDGRNLEPAFPANRPSIILFIDRSSNSSKVREGSKLSLEVLRKFSLQNQLCYQTVRGRDSRVMSSSRSLSGSSSHQSGKVSQTPKVVKIKDNMAFMIVNEGEHISLKNTALESQGNPVYDILTRLLQRESPALKNKETKISEVAKKAGFELLSDDFEVQIIESFQSHNDDNQFREMGRSTTTMLNDPNELTESQDDVSSGGLLYTTENIMTDERKQSEHPDDVANFLETREAAPYDNDNAFSCHVERSCCVEQELPTPEEHVQEEQADKIDSTSSIRQVKSDFGHSSSVLSAGDDMGSIRISNRLRKADEPCYQHQPFLGSFFFIDGGYRLLRTLTAESRIPSLVILDPVMQQHFVFSEATDINYPSVVSFVDRFLNGSLTPYQHSVLSLKTSRDMPKPPLVNLDFHEIDSIPQVTSSTFCELVIGFIPCEMNDKLPFSNSRELKSAWKIDVLVLFSTPWCGFCQRMELIVREVHRAFKNSINFSISQSKNDDPTQIKDKKEDLVLNKFPAIFLMDCTLNDCGLFLKPLGKKENYPILLLFRAENKSAITYEGNMSVVSIMEFLESYGGNSHNHNYKGLLWTHSRKGNKDEQVLYASTLAADEKPHSPADKYNKIVLNKAISADSEHPLNTCTPVTSHDKHIHVVVGSILAATDKLFNAAPFDNSTVLIVTMDKNQGFQGLIINKRISWDIFKELDSDLVSLKHAPLYYGGPVRFQTLPLVSLIWKAKEGYTEIVKGVYFGNPVITRQVIEEIKLKEESPDDYWFFLGFSSWGYDQLFQEITEGAWRLTGDPIEHLDWPEN